SFNDTCNNSSAQVIVTKIPVLNAGLDGILNICEGDVQTYDLFDSLNGTPDLGGSWTPALASGGSIFNPALDAFGTYIYSFNDGCNTSLATVTITELPLFDAGLDGILNICEGDVQTYDLFDSLGGSPDLGGSWTPALAGGGSVFNPTLDAFGVYTYSFNDGCNTSSATVTVTQTLSFDAGLDGVLNICEGDVQTYDLFNSLNGTPDLGGSWTPALAGGGSVFNPALDAFGIYTYSFNDGCNTSSATVTVTQTPSLNAGLDGILNICQGDVQTYDLFDSLNGTPDLGGSWTPALAGGGGVFNPTLDTFGTYSYSFNDTCNNSSAQVTVTDIPVLNAGLDGSLDLCQGDVQTYDLFDSLNGTPDLGGIWTPALAGGGSIFDPTLDAFGIYTYSFNDGCNSNSATVTVTETPTLDAGLDGVLNICVDDTQTYDLFDSLNGTPDLGGSWTPALAGGGSVFNPALDTFGTYTYSFNDTCNNSSAQVTVTDIPVLNAGLDGVLNICEGDVQTYDLFDSLNGTPDLGGSWTPALAGGGSIFDPILDTSGIYTYSFNDGCNSNSATVTVTETPILDAGLDGSLDLCQSDTQTYDLFDSLNGTPDLGGSWTPALAGGGSVFNPAIDTFGVYTYSFNDGCNSNSATVTVTQTPSFDAGLDGILNICQGDTQTYDLFDSLNGTPDLGGSWTPALAGGGSIFNPALDAFGVYTYSFNDSCSTAAIVTVTDFPVLNAGLDGVLNICQGDVQTYDLFDSLNGTPDLGGSWTPALADGGSVFNPALDIFGVYTYSFNDGCNSNSATVTVSQTPSLDAGLDGILDICVGDVQTYDLFDSLGGSPDLGGSWTPALASGGSIFDPTLDAFGVYTYSFNDSCGTVATVFVTSIDCIEDDKLFIPDGFSPNGDGINDFFEIKDIRNLFPNFRIEIYNRYGNILFKGNRNTPDWDGTAQQGLKIDGGKAPIGVYFFILEFNDGQKSPIQGRLYLSR
ncbi:MAG TPA: gliding motility-associated C-terminal domain-containing protein, partial [Flavobacterium sp.]|nr:gliding motility-associated C-terminal domain-containing protein [Flavobacterium sp.]